MDNVPKVIAITGFATVALLAIFFALRQVGTLRSEVITISTGTGVAQQLKIVTLLGFDAIPAIDDPTFVDAATGNEQFRPDYLVVGVEINGEARAYGVAFLSSHEIVNDTVGGRPIAVTW